jgi:hypothetical protein
MTRLSCGPVASLLVLCAAACASEGGGATPPLDHLSAEGAYVGYRASGACPTFMDTEHGRFRGERLFPERPLEPESGKFCVYRRIDGGKARDVGAEGPAGAWQKPFRVADMVLARREPVPAYAEDARDPSLSDHSRTLLHEHPAIGRELRSAFLRQAGAQTRPFVAGPVRPTRIAIIDDAPSSEPRLPGEIGHGDAVENVVRELACPAGVGTTGCLVDVRRYAALNRPSPTSISGGLVGDVIDTARAIAQATDEWRALGDGSPLVLNLSIGWAPALGGADPDEDPRTGAVKYALRRAHCLGAVAVAAAGTRSHPGATGMTYPAGWVTAPAPTAAECRELLPDIDFSNAAPDSSPLVHAVSAVDGLDRDVAVRHEGRAALRAYGYFVSTLDHGGAFTRPFTGASIATAVVSATVGAAWAVSPEMTAADVVKLVSLRGVALGNEVENPAHATQTASRVAFCAAVRAAALKAGRRDQVDECVTPPARGGSNPSWVERWSDLVPELAANRASVKPITTGPRASSALRPPTEVTRPWVHPQPGHQICPGCGINEGALFVQFADYVQGVSELQLFARASDGAQLASWALGDPGTTFVADGFIIPSDTSELVLGYTVLGPDGELLAQESPLLW